MISRDSKKKIKVAVAGAGIMGLTIALYLLKNGYDVTIFEKEDRAGGMAATFDFNGLCLEKYYHFICKPDIHYFELLNELGIEDLLRWKNCKIGLFLKNKLYKWGNPLHLLTFPKIDLISKFRYGGHIFSTSRKKDFKSLDNLNAIQWLKNRIGTKAYDTLWMRLFDLKFFQYKDNLSAAWIGARIRRMALSRKHIFSENLKFGYLEGGSNTLFTKIMEKIVNMGGRLQTHSEVEKIVIKKDRVSGVVINGKEHSFDMAVSTIPIPYIEKMVPDLPANTMSLYKKVNNIGIVCAVFKLKHKISDFFWLNTYDQRIKVPGIIEFSNLRLFKDHIIYYPHYLPKNHNKFFQPDEIFLKEALQCFEIINPAFKDHWVMDAAVSRNEYAQPICPPGFLKSLPPIKTTIKGLYIADTSYYYPEDRSISESIGLGKKISKIIINDNDEDEDKNGPGKNI